MLGVPMDTQSGVPVEEVVPQVDPFHGSSGCFSLEVLAG